MKRIRTVIVPNSPWPRPHDWPKITKPVAELTPQPAPTKKVKAKPKAKKADLVATASPITQSVFMDNRFSQLDQSHQLDAARKQLASPATRHSVRKRVHLNLQK